MAAERVGLNARFALGKFRPTTLPVTLVTRPDLHDRLTAGAGQRLTVVVGSAGAGKSVLLSSWVAARPPGVTAWLSCDRADADPVRFWAGFIEAGRAVAPEFGADAADLLGLDNAVSPDVTSSIANDMARLPAGSAIVVDDFHYAASAVNESMSDLVERVPAGTVQLVLASRSDPLRLHRLRMAGELCELRDRDLCFSLDESRDLLAGFGVEVTAADLARLHRRSEGWTAVLQMAALALRAAGDPAQAARALDVGSRTVAEYFVAEVLDQQPPEVAWFMLDTSVLGELTAEACIAATGRPDAAALLHRIDAANLFLIALDDDRASFRYHHLVHQVLRAELRARDRGREQKLQLHAAEWFEKAGDARRAVRHYLAAGNADRALALLSDRVVPGFLHDPGLATPLDLSMIDPALLAEAPDRLLGLAAYFLSSGDPARGGQCLDLFERVQPSIPPESALAARLAAMRATRYAQIGRLNDAVAAALAARDIQERTGLTGDWKLGVPLLLLRVYPCLEDFQAVEREAAVALAAPGLPESARLVLVPGARALAWFQYGQLAQAAQAADAAAIQARRLGFDRHFYAVDHLRALAGLALERRDLGTAEQLAERALSITEHRGKIFEFLALLDRAEIWAARGQVRQALTTVQAARLVLAGTGSVLLARADELEALLRLSLGDLQTPADLARGLPEGRRSLLRARIALASGDHHGAQEHLQSPSLNSLTPRSALVRQILRAEAALKRDDPTAAGILNRAIQTARLGGFLHTIVSTAPQVTSYLIAHSAHPQPDPFTEQLTAAALQVRASQAKNSRSRRMLVEPLTSAEARILTLLPTSTYLQMAATLGVSRNTVKTHLRSVYQKLGVTTRQEAIERALDLRLI